MNIHIIMPFSRHHLKDRLIEAYRPLGVILHPIMFYDEVVQFPDEPWIIPYYIGQESKDCKALMPGTYKRNQFIRGCKNRSEFYDIRQILDIHGAEIINTDYYVTADDDDMYEPNVFDAIKKMNDDIVIISMKRGNNVPDDASELRQYPTDTLFARPEYVQVGWISAQQMFVKGRIFKEHLHNEESHDWDGELAVHYEESERVVYRPDLFALFNFYEPQRWAERKKMLSIVVPVFNQREMTSACLEAIVANTRDYEIILVDNGSDPPIENATIRYGTNLGFPVAVNQGIRAAKGDVIVLLNNDVIVTENWFQRLEWHLLKYDIVGPMTNYCAGLQRVTIPVYRDEKELNQRAIEFQVANAFQAQEVNWIIGFCMAFKKALFDELGVFDDSLWPCSGEEIDFCCRAKAAGYKVAICHDTYLHHEGSQTFRDMQQAGVLDYKTVCERNDAHLAEKWPDIWFRQAVAA